jgi:hypothetical protein
VKPAVSLNPGEHPFLARIKVTKNKSMRSAAQEKNKASTEFQLFKFYQQLLVPHLAQHNLPAATRQTYKLSTSGTYKLSYNAPLQ